MKFIYYYFSSHDSYPIYTISLQMISKICTTANIHDYFTTNQQNSLFFLHKWLDKLIVILLEISKTQTFFVRVLVGWLIGWLLDAGLAGSWITKIVQSLFFLNVCYTRINMWLVRQKATKFVTNCWTMNFSQGYKFLIDRFYFILYKCFISLEIWCCAVNS